MLQRYPRAFAAPRLCCLIAVLLAFLSLTAQALPPDDPKVTLSARKISLADLFQTIQQQTGYRFVYSNEELDVGTFLKNVDFRDAALETVLRLILRDRGVTWVYIGKAVVFKKQKIVQQTTAPSDNPDYASSNDTDTLITISGKVLDENGSGLPGAAVMVDKTTKGTATDGDGNFIIRNVSTKAALHISMMGYETIKTPVNGKPFHSFRMKKGVTEINEFIVVSTGYQKLPKERATGSFDFLNNKLLNRTVSTDVISRLEGVASGVLFNKNTQDAQNGPDISIRGHSTIFSNDQPLIVVDNFPYDGDIRSINPNDVESITILKDAAAASIWGVKSGNGVIVITTKRGMKNQKLAVEANANVTVGGKPDLFYSPYFINSSDFINIEKDLFARGVYDADLTDIFSRPPVSPVVQLLADARAGLITTSEANARVDSLRGNDIRQEIGKYFYQNSIAQQYSVSMRGGGRNSSFYMSVGYDKNRSNLVGNGDNRITISSMNKFTLSENLEVSAGINYAISNYKANNPIGEIATGIRNVTYPYAQIKDRSGNPSRIAKSLAMSYTDTVMAGRFLNWDYVPYDELINSDKTGKQNDMRLAFGLKYKVIEGLNAEINYQYQRGTTDNERYFSEATYNTRDMINRYTQINSDGSLSYPVPRGGILEKGTVILTSHRARGQLNYNKIWNDHHDVAVLAGAEISQTISETEQRKSFGFNKNTRSTQPVDLVTYFNTNPYGSAVIPGDNSFGRSTDRYISYFGNMAYTYLGRYTFSASGRIDKSNLFGVRTNQKAVPLYSTGLSWDISKEQFYHIQWLPYLKLRATYGYNGNVDKGVTAVTTIRQSNYSYYSGALYGIITNPGNAKLRWERIRMINLGLDYAFRDNTISGSIDYFMKYGIDLMGDSPVPPSTGLTVFRGNTANTRGNGVDIVLNTENIRRKNFKWTTNFLFSYALDKVVKYDILTTASAYVSFGAGNTSYILPLTGRPIFAMYSYKWAGLSADNGDPLGYLNGKESKEYKQIISSTPLDQLVYHGPSRPTIFGSLRNNFSYKKITLSFNILYKFNYFFRRSSFTSADMPWSGHKDYYNRWQKPGDEKITHVPSFQYPPVDADRSEFYEKSEILVEKGDHIRLQDIFLSYDMDKGNIRKLPFPHIQFYCSVRNVGILWRANRYGLDPDLSTGASYSVFPTPRTISIGAKVNLQ